jgi:hypothetical protein
MTHKEIQDFANEMLSKHAASVWSFKWNNRMTAWGMCDEADWTIQLSLPLFNALKNKEDAKITILHEIAHAIVGCVEGHNAEWKAAARKLGIINPLSKSNYELDSSDFYKYVLLIDQGDHFEDCKSRGWHRRPRKKLTRCFLPKREEETMGRLFYAPQPAWNKYLWNEISYEQFKKECWQ